MLSRQTLELGCPFQVGQLAGELTSKSTLPLNSAASCNPFYFFSFSVDPRMHRIHIAIPRFVLLPSTQQSVVAGWAVGHVTNCRSVRLVSVDLFHTYPPADAVQLPAGLRLCPGTRSPGMPSGSVSACSTWLPLLLPLPLPLRLKMQGRPERSRS